uniref:Uncharacterized protein n=1 Tax=viral metagenome TaxID=1070528 RepID=A0A6M3LCD1_9ZZZZ
MPEENTKRCPLISQFFLTTKPSSALMPGKAEMGGEPMPFIGFCQGDKCELWSKRVADDGGIKEGCCFRLMAEK